MQQCAVPIRIPMQPAATTARFAELYSNWRSLGFNNVAFVPSPVTAAAFVQFQWGGPPAVERAQRLADQAAIRGTMLLPGRL